MPSLRLEDQLCFTIYSAGHAFGRAYKPLLDPLGITYSQYLVLLVLWADDNRTVNSIGKALFLESSTLTPLLKRLQAQGLITRVRDVSDERQVRVQLTSAGKKLAQLARNIPKCLEKATAMSADALTRLRCDIEALRANLIAASVTKPLDN
jgi:MarR family transcriptional regulator, organic hydroperoxide resistance regulator